MKTNPYRSNSVAAAVAAAFVTTFGLGLLVESFEPAQLLRLERDSESNAIVALDRRAEPASSRLA